MTADLLKDPHIMQALTSTYVRTLNEVVSKSQSAKGPGQQQPQQQPIAAEASSQSLALWRQEQRGSPQSGNTLPTGSDADNEGEEAMMLDDVVESTFEEFILAAAALAAATANSASNAHAASDYATKLKRLGSRDG